MDKFSFVDADGKYWVDKNWRTYWDERDVSIMEDVETLRIGKDGYITEIGQRPDTLDEIEGQYMGLMKFSENGIEILKTIYHEAYEKGNIRGKKIKEAFNRFCSSILIEFVHQVYFKSTT